jgi:hypothetical protein
VLYSQVMPYIYTNPYKAPYEGARQELEQRRAELAYVTRRIAQLEESIRALESLAADDGIAPTASLPELCAQTLQMLPKIGMTATDVMNALANRGINISQYSNPLALLHTTLTRLCKPGSGYRKGKSPDGQPLYVFDPDELSGLYRLRPTGKLSDLM